MCSSLKHKYKCHNYSHTFEQPKRLLHLGFLLHIPCHGVKMFVKYKGAKSVYYTFACIITAKCSTQYKWLFVRFDQKISPTMSFPPAVQYGKYNSDERVLFCRFVAEQLKVFVAIHSKTFFPHAMMQYPYFTIRLLYIILECRFVTTMQ